MQDKRITTRLVEYWERLKGENSLPEISRFNSAQVDEHWPQCIRLRVEPGGREQRNYVYEYVGRKITEAYGRNLTGTCAHAQLKDIPGASVLKKMDDLVQTAIPQLDEGQFISPKNKIIKYRAVAIPFGRMTMVTHVIVGLSWREF